MIKKIIRKNKPVGPDEPVVEPQSMPENEPASTDIPSKSSKKDAILRIVRRLKSKRYLPVTGLLGVVILLLIAYSVPASRYTLLNYISKADARITVINATTKQPNSGAIVTLSNGSSSETNKDGVAFFDNSKFGKTSATIQKNTYELKTVDLVITKDGIDLGQVALTPTGVPVNIQAKDWLSGKVLSNFKVFFDGDTKEAAVSVDGIASINIPYESTVMNLKISSEGYNDSKVSIDINDKNINKDPSSKDDVSKVDAELVLAGEHYFLSNRDGDISFYSVNYDGSNVQKLVTTNQKTDYLEYYAVPDTEDYVALLSSTGKDTQGRQDQLAVIKPDEKSLKIVDEAPGQKLDFSIISVSKDAIIYQVAYDTDRADKFKIKSYNFNTQKLTTHYSFSNYISPTYDQEHNNVYLIESIGYYPYDVGFTRKLVKVDLSNNTTTVLAEGSNFGFNEIHPSKPDKLLYSIYDAYYNTAQTGYYLMDLADNSKVEYIGSNWPEFEQPDEIPDSEKGQTSPNKTNRVWIDQRDGRGRLILNETTKLITGKVDELSVNNIIRWVNETQLTVSGYNGAEAADFIVDVETGNYKKITNTLLSQYGGY